MIVFVFGFVRNDLAPQDHHQNGQHSENLLSKNKNKTEFKIKINK